jgi:hypothetical protein
MAKRNDYLSAILLIVLAFILVGSIYLPGGGSKSAEKAPSDPYLEPSKQVIEVKAGETVALADKLKIFFVNPQTSYHGNYVNDSSLRFYSDSNIATVYWSDGMNHVEGKSPGQTTVHVTKYIGNLAEEKTQFTIIVK